MFVSIMLKGKMKKMKSTSSMEEFREEFSIPLLIRLQFVEEKYVNPIEGSPIEGELFLLKGYFEAGLRLPCPPLFRDLAHHLCLTPNQFCVDTI